MGPARRQSSWYIQDQRVNSLDVADRFDKQHKNVLATIQGIECSEEFRRLNFQLATYNDSQGKPRPFYKLTRDGYCAWAIQRKWERKDMRSYDLIKDRVTHEADMWAHGKVLYY